MTDVEQQRVLVNTPSEIRRKMMGSKQYKKARDSKDDTQTKTPEQN